jgi:hypothetical protein
MVCTMSLWRMNRGFWVDRPEIERKEWLPKIRIIKNFVWKHPDNYYTLSRFLLGKGFAGSLEHNEGAPFFSVCPASRKRCKCRNTPKLFSAHGLQILKVINKPLKFSGFFHLLVLKHFHYAGLDIESARRIQLTGN